MTFTRRIGSVAATLGLAAAGLVGPLASATSADVGVSATTGAAAADTLYGPYSSQGTCNYWRYAVQAAGHQTSVCFPVPPIPPDNWYFVAR